MVFYYFLLFICILFVLLFILLIIKLDKKTIVITETNVFQLALLKENELLKEKLTQLRKDYVELKEKWEGKRYD
jgi:hypothetical protein